MDSRVLLFLVVAIGYVAVDTAVAQKKVFCYYSSEAQYRQGKGKFVPEDIDPFLCTHIIYAFVNTTNVTLGPINWNDQTRNGLYARAVALKQINPALRVLLAVGGWTMGSEPFVPMVADPRLRRLWVENVVAYLRRYGFDGFDMDWEFPAIRGSPPEDKYRFSQLLTELQTAFREEARQTGNEKLILTLATAAGSYLIETAYEPHVIMRQVDYMLLMTYNYHGLWENKTGHHSGMFPNFADTTPFLKELNQDWSVSYWLNRGMPRDKLIMGIATYGMSYTLRDPSDNGLRAPAIGGGWGGPYTKELGILAVYEICEFLTQRGWNRVYVPGTEAPYAFLRDQWVGYDDVDSVTKKAKYIMEHDLGGAFIWSVEMDDFTGQSCKAGRYPLLNAINRQLQGGKLEKPSAEKDDSSADEPWYDSPPMNNPSPQKQCFLGGGSMFPDPSDCHSFYLCLPVGPPPALNHTTFRLTCPQNLAFEPNARACVWLDSCQ